MQVGWVLRVLTDLMKPSKSASPLVGMLASRVATSFRCRWMRASASFLKFNLFL